MKNLNDIYESLLDDEDIIANETEIYIKVKNFLDDHYKFSKPYKIKHDKNGKYIVDCIDGCITLKTSSLINLTNGEFVFGVCDEFNCDDCYKLVSLEGSPEIVRYRFSCANCDSLKTLKGAPKSITGVFDCTNCNRLESIKGLPKKIDGSVLVQMCRSLKTLEGGPEQVLGDFNCSRCDKLKNLKGAPKVVDYCFDCSYGYLTSLEGSPTYVGGDFDCDNNDKLESLKGCPKEVKGHFNCQACGQWFETRYVLDLCDVGGHIIN